MAIVQLTTSNTFGQWLNTTQALVNKWNYVEDTANSINLVYSNTTNVYSNTIKVYSNTVNVYSNTIKVYSNTVNVYNSIQDYVSIAYDTANNSYEVANLAYDTANAAVNAANAVFANVFNITDTTTSPNTYFPLFSSIYLGVPQDDVYVSHTKLTYVPSKGQLNATHFNSTSDEKQKTDIEPIKNALENVLNMRGVRFKWKENNDISIGLIAQEVEKILPEVVSTNNEGEKSVSYGNIVGLLIEAIKSLKLEINEIKSIINNK